MNITEVESLSRAMPPKSYINDLKHQVLVVNFWNSDRRGNRVYPSQFLYCLSLCNFGSSSNIDAALILRGGISLAQNREHKDNGREHEECHNFPLFSCVYPKKEDQSTILHHACKISILRSIYVSVGGEDQWNSPPMISYFMHHQSYL